MRRHLITGKLTANKENSNVEEKKQQTYQRADQVAHQEKQHLN